MTQAEKEKFINDLVGHVRREIVESIPKMPEEWDGHELRLYIAEKFSDKKNKLAPSRLKAYASEVLVRNL